MKRLVAAVVAIALIVAIALLAARMLLPLPDVSGRTVSNALSPDPTTLLGRRMADGLVAHPGQTGVIPLRDGHDALASRLALAQKAERSIDSQYYIWHDDTAGILLLDALYRASLRGVRVRLLLDDNGVPDLEAIMATLNAQENFEIRLFNPSTVRTPKLLGYTFDFMRMNRRMHNKSFIADGAAAIIGGRNIGNEYFQVGTDAFFVDMDVLATGRVVPATVAMFDDYWNSKSAFEVERIIGGSADLAAFERRVIAVRASAEAKTLQDDLQSSADRYRQDSGAIEWTDVRLVADDPVKGLGIAAPDQLMITQLGEILGGIEARLDLVSAYFIPGRRGTAYFAKLAQSGKDVRILTNAMNTTDVLLVHAGYSKYRRDLLKAGVDLYELKLADRMSAEAELQLKPFGVSGASLHAKTFALDGKRIFIGSFNFDPRSALLNCEMGFLIDSSALAGRVDAAFDGPLQTFSYRPELTPDDNMVWQETIGDGNTVTWQQEPNASWWQQVAIVVIGLLPIEWLL